MAGFSIYYRRGRPLQLERDAVFQTRIRPVRRIAHGFVELDTDGALTIRAGFAWDGPSGPFGTIEWKKLQRAALAHDALYRLMRALLLDRRIYRRLADRELRHLCREDKMARPLVWLCLWSVKTFGKGCTDPAAENQLMVAP